MSFLNRENSYNLQQPTSERERPESRPRVRKVPVLLLPLFGCVIRSVRRRRAIRRRRRATVGKITVAVLVGGRFDWHGLLRFVVVRIVPRLPRAGREDVVERRGEDVHARRNHEHNSPLRNGGL